MPNQPKKDLLLWKSFKAGDDKAFYELYDQYSDALYSFGMQFCKDSDFVKDCIHDLFLELHKYREQLRPTDSIQFYLFRTLKRIIHKQRLSMSLLKLDHKLEKTIRAHSPACDETIIDSERQEEGMDLLANAISQLTKVQQRALFLKFEQDLNYTEIAVLLNISVESARTNMYRALKSLRKSLSKHEISLNLFVLLYSKNQL
ncbi:RNA polymerase sigma factor [Sunxiuqinia dokdonensis]|uniref:RNA polymerase sigma factor n=1 Tax=Sunxiuqinia dokdonensis TaxID=1409788 RepID=UPI00069F65D3|nr:sigma-70 family RNA polymerase sigma factor [Sunxiuqinia dokdonensis]